MMDFIINKSLSNLEITTIFSKALKCNAHHIEIINDEAELIKLNNTKVHIISTPLKGEFLTKISVLRISDELKNSNTETEIAYLISKQLKSKVLITDNSPNPFSMTLIFEQKKRQIFLNADSLENDFFFLEETI